MRVFNAGILFHLSGLLLAYEANCDKNLIPVLVLACLSVIFLVFEFMVGTLLFAIELEIDMFR